MAVFQIRALTVLIILFSLIGSSTFIPNSSAQEESQIPDWVKNVAGWWATNDISEKEFLNGIEYLINNNIIYIPFMPCGAVAAAASSDATLEAKLIPDWVKNVAGWWATGQIEDADFLNGIEYLIKKDILGIDNEKILSKVPIEDVKFSSAWTVNKDAQVFVSSSFFEIYGRNGDCLTDTEDGISKWRSTTLGLNPSKMDQYNEVALWNDPQNAVVVYPYFTFAAYQPQGFYDYFKGNCDDCTTTKFVHPKSQYTSSGKGHQALTLLGYSSITDVDIDKNPSILQQFDKVIMLHNEYVTRTMFDAITSHPNVIYLYPNALYAEIEVNYIDETITLIRGHNYPEQEIMNGFDWPFDNTHPYEYDSLCYDMEFYKTAAGWMTNCYPENVFLADTEQLFNILQLLKDL
uniref:Uncharacterized protein n=1 Tax=uncultured marine thaumarchaeote SAT1000_15_H02 TaxID=1456386 RepID=A0A075I9T1_9ARCH|nr:hypothetical protein [uncultured marine thaumarchaeote SAT1000_15_H02]